MYGAGYVETGRLEGRVARQAFVPIDKNIEALELPADLQELFI